MAHLPQPCSTTSSRVTIASMRDNAVDPASQLPAHHLPFPHLLDTLWRVCEPLRGRTQPFWPQIATRLRLSMTEHVVSTFWTKLGILWQTNHEMWSERMVNGSNTILQTFYHLVYYLHHCQHPFWLETALIHTTCHFRVFLSKITMIYLVCPWETFMH